jgi:hypothetical protein
MSSRMKAQLVCDALKMAIWQRRGTDKLTSQVEKTPEILVSLDHDTFPGRKSTHSKQPIVTSRN